ncbi:(p)ppGpp synthase/HD superfamily hydrolase [Kitasatospora sp. GP30]|uniref:HD domain-containing protein n=1 Tax=Kitasatospora sp. GP30 TaxID=3035084 RepID=UPI000C711774|nr:HD domain-containing protein [Kitasatospora sp. GP30]MDH6141807.1 (p)ppGpp synthase/HD superfamily hydrolase [Kitasatospora sp. GP30]
MTLTVADVDALAERAHAGQLDKIGVPYIKHVRAVGDALASFGPHAQMAGLLHDVLEDTDWTAEGLRAAGVPTVVVDTVVAVTKQPGVSYEEMIRSIAGKPRATLVKIADNAHNSLPERAADLSAPDRERLAAKYRAARRVLWPAAGSVDVAVIVGRVNPALLVEL